MSATESPAVCDGEAQNNAASEQALHTQNSQVNQLKFEPLRLATAKAFFEKRVRSLSGIDEADRYIFDGHLTAATWVSVCDAELEPALISYLEAVRAQAKAAIIAHNAREKLQTAIWQFHQRMYNAWADPRGGFAS